LGQRRSRWMNVSDGRQARADSVCRVKTGWMASSTRVCARPEGPRAGREANAAAFARLVPPRAAAPAPRAPAPAPAVSCRWSRWRWRLAASQSAASFLLPLQQPQPDGLLPRGVAGHVRVDQPGPAIEEATAEQVAPPEAPGGCQ